MVLFNWSSCSFCRLTSGGAEGPASLSNMSNSSSWPCSVCKLSVELHPLLRQTVQCIVDARWIAAAAKSAAPCSDWIARAVSPNFRRETSSAASFSWSSFAFASVNSSCTKVFDHLLLGALRVEIGLLKFRDQGLHRIVRLDPVRVIERNRKRRSAPSIPRPAANRS